MQKITPNLWFDSQAEEAANFYVSVFNDSKIKKISRYPKASESVSGKTAGSVMTVAFEIEGQDFLALNGGPQFKFSEAVSFIVNCEDQEEVDYYWEKLTEGGDEKDQICGWLKDKFGLSWQIVPKRLEELMSDSDPEKVERVTAVFLEMKKIVVADLEKAFRGK
ncbi:MAG: VOC family protein [Parcubacteria group bacterium]|jgi:predicted 3-demethylubiquinone-9 3-methyltransferase (glyoxalase superfamily)